MDADFTDVYRLGGPEAPEMALFTIPGSLAFDGVGNLHVLDLAAVRVVMVDPLGQLVRSVGRRGDGPGESWIPTGILVWRDGSSAIADGGRGLLNLFGPGGDFVRSVTMNSTMTLSGGMETSMRPDPAGGAVFRQGAPAVLGQIMARLGQRVDGGAGAGSAVDDRGIERVVLTGDEIATEPVVRGWRPAARSDRSPNASGSAGSTAELARQLTSADMHFEPQLLWDVLPDGVIAYSDSSAYAVRLVNRQGSTVGVLRRGLSPQPVDRRIRSRTIEMALRRHEDEVRTMEAAGVAVQRSVSGHVRQAIEAREFFDEVPVIRGLRATWEGGVWVRRVGDQPWDDDGPIDVFGPTRTYLGTLLAGTALPDAFGPDGLVAYWETDDLDVPTIVVKRLPQQLR